MALKGSVGRLQNALVKLKQKAQNVEAEQARMHVAFREFGKTIDEALIKKGALPKGSKNASEAAALLAALRTAQTTTEGASQSLRAAARPTSACCTAASPPTRARAAPIRPAATVAATVAFGGVRHRGGRWGAAHAAVTSIGGAIARRQQQIAALERSSCRSSPDASGGTDSIK
jgi:hypothetical protein